MFSKMAASNKIGHWSRPTLLTPFVYVLREKKTKNCLEIHFSFECRKLDRNVIVFSRFDSPRARKPVVREGPLSSRKCRHELLLLHTAWLGANRNKIFLLKFESLFIYLDTFRLTGRIEWQHTHSHWCVSGRLQFHRWQLNFNFRVAEMSSSSGGRMDSIIDSTIFNLIRLDCMRVAGPIE